MKALRRISVLRLVVGLLLVYVAVSRAYARTSPELAEVERLTERSVDEINRHLENSDAQQQINANKINGIEAQLHTWEAIAGLVMSGGIVLTVRSNKSGT